MNSGRFRETEAHTYIHILYDIYHAFIFIVMETKPGVNLNKKPEDFSLQSSDSYLNFVYLWKQNHIFLSPSLSPFSSLSFFSYPSSTM